MQENIKAVALNYGIEIVGSLHINEIGLDFRVAIGSDSTGKKWVLRVPRRANLYPSIQKEQQVLRFLESRLSFGVPGWKVVQPDLVAYPLLENEPALVFDPVTYEVTWNIDQTSSDYLRSFAYIASSIHSISTEEARTAGFRHRSYGEIRRSLRDYIELVKNELGLAEHLERRWLSWLENNDLWPNFSTVIHGDLYAGHTLARHDGTITGVIDWSEAEINDPAIDFAGHFLAFGEQKLDETLDLYARAGGTTWPFMKQNIMERAAAAPLRYAMFALKTKEPSHIAAAKEQLK